MEIPEDSDIVDFKGEGGDNKSNIDNRNMDYAESESSACEIEHANILSLESVDSDGDAQ